MSATASQPDALAAAERATAALSRSLEGKPDDTPIQTDVRSLRGVAAVVESLRADLSRCGGADCFGRRREGEIRTWVRHEQLALNEARAQAAEARAAALESALRQVAEATELPPGQIDILWDWSGAAHRARALAEAALLGPRAPYTPAPAAPCPAPWTSAELSDA